MSPPASFLRFGLLRTTTIRSVARISEVQHQHCLDTSCPPNGAGPNAHAHPCLPHVPCMAVTLTYLPHHLFLPLIVIPDSTRTPKAALLHTWSPSTPAGPPCISLLCAPCRRGACSPHQPPSLAPATLTAAPSGCR